MIKGTIENPYRVISFGGGRQTTAMIVAIANGLIDPVDAVVFANVGEDSENPATLEYIAEVMIPFMKKHKIPYTEVRKTAWGKPSLSVYQEAARPDTRRVVIPAFADQGGHTLRACTDVWKIKPVDKYIRSHYKDKYVNLGLGISIDEIRRARSQEWKNSYTTRSGRDYPVGYWKRYWYPLIDLGWSKDDCVKYVVENGLPEPPKSSCYFCPFKTIAEWVETAKNQPELFSKAVSLEKALNAKGLPRTYYLARTKKPLSNLVEGQTAENEDDFCDTGYCLT